MHACGEFLGLFVVGKFGFHPDGVGVGGVCDGAVYGAPASALESIIAFAGTGSVPVPVDVDAGDGFGEGSGFRVTLAFDFGCEAGNEIVRFGVGVGFDGGDDGIVEEFEIGLRGPGIFDGLKFCACFTGTLTGYH